MIKLYKNIIGNSSLISYNAPISGYSSTFAGCAPMADWLTLYSVDFTTLPTGSVYGDGPITINGITWDRINSAYAQYMSYSANGFELKANSLASEWWGTTRTFPGLVLPLSRVFSGSFSSIDLPNNFALRIIAQTSGFGENETYEQVECGLEVSSSINNHLSYCIRSSGGDGFLYRGVQRCINGVSADTATNYSDLNCTVIVFNIENQFFVDFSTYSPPSEFAYFETTNSLNARNAARVYWDNYGFASAKGFAFDKYSDLNFCFAPNTGNSNRDNVAYFTRFYVQVRAK